MNETARRGFGARLDAATAAFGRLCVGIDPHAFLLEHWGLPADASGARDFGLRVVDACAGRVGVVKPQVAFFERYGSAGYAALEVVLAAARGAGLVVIADAKRGDVGSTVEAYGEAWLTPGSPLEADAMTIYAYQGVGSLAAPIALAQAAGKGLFVVAATSNVESIPIQRAVVSAPELPAGRTQRSVARVIIDDVVEVNAHAAQNDADGLSTGTGAIGVVLGGTLNLASYGIDIENVWTPGLPVLGPGFGDQGARPADARRTYGTLVEHLLVSESRSVLGAGPSGIQDAVTRCAQEVRELVG